MTLTYGPNLGLLVNGTVGEAHYAELMKQWRGLDALVMAVVKGVGTTAPPGSPADGDVYIPGAGATGAWTGLQNKLVRWSSTAAVWEVFTPKAGWSVRDSVYAGSIWVFSGASWAPDLTLNSAPGSSRTLWFRTNGLPRWGISAMSSAESGSNVGSDLVIADFNDAGTWLRDALTINRASGLVTLPGGINLGQTDLKNYQEGTWTPAPVGLTTTGSPTYAGRYTRIGRLCLLSLTITPNGGTVASTANSSYFSGLPFTVLGSSPAPAADAAVGSYPPGVVNGTNLYLPTMPASNLNRFICAAHEI